MYAYSNIRIIDARIVDPTTLLEYTVGHEDIFELGWVMILALGNGWCLHVDHIVALHGCLNHIASKLNNNIHCTDS